MQVAAEAALAAEAGLVDMFFISRGGFFKTTVEEAMGETDESESEDEDEDEDDDEDEEDDEVDEEGDVGADSNETTGFSSPGLSST